jgi:hypothetical protein
MNTKPTAIDCRLTARDIPAELTRNAQRRRAAAVERVTLALDLIGVLAALLALAALCALIRFYK